MVRCQQRSLAEARFGEQLVNAFGDVAAPGVPHAQRNGQGWLLLGVGPQRHCRCIQVIWIDAIDQVVQVIACSHIPMLSEPSMVGVSGSKPGRRIPAAQPKDQEPGEVGVGQVAAHDPEQHVDAFAGRGHLAARAVGECDRAVDVPVVIVTAAATMIGPLCCDRP